VGAGGRPGVPVGFGVVGFGVVGSGGLGGGDGRGGGVVCVWSAAIGRRGAVVVWLVAVWLVAVGAVAVGGIAVGGGGEVVGGEAEEGGEVGEGERAGGGGGGVVGVQAEQGGEVDGEQHLGWGAVQAGQVGQAQRLGEQRVEGVVAALGGGAAQRGGGVGRVGDGEGVEQDREPLAVRMPSLAPAGGSDLDNVRPPGRHAAPLDGALLEGPGEPPRSRGCAIVTWGR